MTEVGATTKAPAAPAALVLQQANLISAGPRSPADCCLPTVIDRRNVRPPWFAGGFVAP